MRRYLKATEINLEEAKDLAIIIRRLDSHSWLRL